MWCHKRKVHVGSWATSWRCYWESHMHVRWPSLHWGAWSRRAWETPWLNSAHVSSAPGAPHFGSWLTFWMLVESPWKTVVAAGESFFRDLKYQNLKPAAGTAHQAVVGTWHLPCQLLLPTHLCPASMPICFDNSLPHSAKLDTQGTWGGLRPAMHKSLLFGADYLVPKNIPTICVLDH